MGDKPRIVKRKDLWWLTNLYGTDKSFGYREWVDAVEALYQFTTFERLMVPRKIGWY